MRSKRGWLVLVCVVAALFFIRPGAQKIKSRIANSISLALGRPVEISSASFRLLPHPGFELQNFVVHDDPSFSAEPMLRSSDVTASLRLWSLLHGKMEIARLSLSEPSLNLVRNASGHWNLEELLQRTAQTTVAPTAKSRIERRPGFPYIEADSGRINLKIGEEKKPYAVTDADFSLWQDSENSWGLRLEGKPVRTDFNLNNTGIIDLSGTWQRSSSLHETPLQFTLQWKNGQLGQITTLSYGNDKGWRGKLGLLAQVSGTPDDLRIRASASIENFRHYDVAIDSDFPFAAQCDGRYISSEQSLREVSCQMPFQSGFLNVRGSVASLLGPRDYQFTFAAQDIPMQSVEGLLARLRGDFPQNLSATGRLNGNIRLASAVSTNTLHWQGQGEIADFHLGSSASSTDLALGTLPFTVQLPLSGATYKRTPSLGALPSGAGVELGPVNLHLGHTGATLAHAWISPSAFEFRLEGDTQIQRLLQAARAFNIPTPQTSAEGSATVNLRLQGAWADYAAGRVTGTAQLHSVRAQVKGLNAPLEIAAANLALAPEQVTVQKLSASLAGIAWQGSLILPRPCAVQEACASHFNLRATALTDSSLDTLLAAPSRYGRWYNLLTENSSPVFLSHLQASGRLAIGKIAIHKLAATDFVASANLNAGNLHLSQIRAKLLGGRHTGELTMDFSSGTPVVRASGTFDHIALEQLASFMQDDWISGSADGTYEFSGSGRNVMKIFSSATVESNVTARSCVFPHVTLTEQEPLHAQRFDGDILFSNGEFEIKQGTLETAEGNYEVNGTASLTRNITFRMTRNDGPEFTINGSLAQPRVIPSKNRVARISSQH
jgi:AsmA protein